MFWEANCIPKIIPSRIINSILINKHEKPHTELLIITI